MSSDVLEVIVVVPFVFSTFAFITWVLVNGWQRRQRLKLTTDFNAKLLDRIGSVKDFSDFLQTEGGARFMDNLTVERSSPRPLDGILRAGQIGVVLMTLGIGLLGLRWYFGARYPAGSDFEVATVLGTVTLSLGLGFLISAVASFRVGRSLGLLDLAERTRHSTAAAIGPR